ncbi:MAG: hypothetical protein EOP09_17365 [Proteobacteria bacterium]|nr:MAG: hypothetical protein EOP09_17365 [Pseudomonadota bacterium]
MATLKAKNLKKSVEKLNKKNILTTVIGGALLLYAYKNRSSKFGRLASVAGTSLLGRGLGGTAGIF